MASEVRIAHRTALSDADVTALADILIDCTKGGASVGFMDAITQDDAEAFWRAQMDDVVSGARALFVAELDGRVVGTVQVIPAGMPNQPHRADISKMLVHRDARRNGIGGKLMNAAETHARSIGRTVLVLDTASDDARRLYERQGWVRVGDVPDFALWPDGRLVETTFYYRKLT